MTHIMRLIKKNLFAAGAAIVAYSGTALANTPTDGGISMLPAKSGIAQEVHLFHNWILMPIMTGISVFVLALLLWVAFRYNSKANPVPRKFSHNTLVEVLWTGIPILILLFIALFSFDLLYKEDVIPDGKQVIVEADGAQNVFAFANDFSERRVVSRANHIDVLIADSAGIRTLAHRADYTLEGLGDPEVSVNLNETPAPGQNVIIRGGRTRVGPVKFLGLFGEDKSKIALAPTVTLKANGYQWGWTYSYPDFGDFEVTSSMLPEDQTTPELYRFAVDNPIYLPVGESIRVTTTARDVIHSWAMPNFAVKVDAVPGRINETWFSALEEGTYYGQCSEICGIKHSFMPIEIRVVSRDAFIAWVGEQRELNGLPPLGDEAAAVTEVAAVETSAEAAIAEAPADAAETETTEVAEVEEITTAAAAVVPASIEEVERCETELNALVQTTKIEFRIASAEIGAQSYGVLDEIAAIAKNCAGTNIEIAGHTDSTGSEETNTLLSGLRAKAVADYLIAKDVPATRLTAQGYGPAQPIASNATREGRAQNRRIEFSVSAPEAATAE